jgi:hypothetical protein
MGCGLVLAGRGNSPSTVIPDGLQGRAGAQEPTHRPLGPGSPLRYGRGDEKIGPRYAITTTTTRRFWARASGVFRGLAGVVSP